MQHKHQPAMKYWYRILTKLTGRMTLKKRTPNILTSLQTLLAATAGRTEDIYSRGHEVHKHTFLSGTMKLLTSKSEPL
jgi:predicted nuclease with RNAse H fold